MTLCAWPLVTQHDLPPICPVRSSAMHCCAPYLLSSCLKEESMSLMRDFCCSMISAWEVTCAHMIVRMQML